MLVLLIGVILLSLLDVLLLFELLFVVVVVFVLVELLLDVGFGFFQKLIKVSPKL
jgi:hypothetical protein